MSGNLIFQSRTDWEKLVSGFRPLSGNLIFQYVICFLLVSQIILFPSPVGESYFSIGLSRTTRKGWASVSVPCRGILFFNPMYSLFCIALLRFRPLSGNLIFQSDKSLLKFHLLLISVPCRGILFFNPLGTIKDEKQYNNFRPLSGNLIFQWRVRESKRRVNKKFPSPIGESYFSIRIC